MGRLVHAMVESKITYEQAVHEFQAGFIWRTIAAQQGHLGRAAKELQMHPNTLTRLLKKLGIDVVQIRSKRKHNASSTT